MYYIKSKEVVYGPVDFSVIRTLIINKKYSDNDFIRQSGAKDWLKFSEFASIAKNLFQEAETKHYLFPEGSLGWTWFQVVFPTVAVCVIVFQVIHMLNRPTEVKQVAEKKTVVAPAPVLIPAEPEVKPVEQKPKENKPEVYVFQAAAWMQDGQKALSVQKLIYDYIQNIPQYVLDQQTQRQPNIKNSDGSVPRDGQWNRGEQKQSLEDQKNEVNGILNNIKFYGGLVNAHPDNMKNSILLESLGLSFSHSLYGRKDRTVNLCLNMSIPNSLNEINDRHSYKVRIEYSLGEPTIFEVTNYHVLKNDDKIFIPIRIDMLPAIKKITLVKIPNYDVTRTDDE